VARRRAFVILALAALLPVGGSAATDALPAVVLYAPKVCLSCIEWASHLREHGFQVTISETDDLARVRRRLKVPPALESRHTAAIAGYFVEGHVPADDIKTLLKEKPKARGLAVPGLPFGAPGYEPTGSASNCERGCTILDSGEEGRPPRRELYDTLLVAPNGQTSVWARH
jgi:hypothetical protein